LGVIGLAAILPRTVIPSTIGLHAFFIGFYIPLSMMVAAKDEYYDFFGLTTLFFTILIVFTRSIKIEKGINSSFSYANEILIIISSLVIILTLVLFIDRGGMEYVNYSLDDVYSVREDINEILTGYIGYLSDWSKNVFLPLIFVISIFRKNVFLIAFSIFMFLLFFVVTSSKAVLVYPVVILFVSYIVKFGPVIPMLYAGAFSAAFISHVFYILFGKNTLSGLVTLRTFSVPPSDALLYYQYFQSHSPLYWSNTILGAPFRTHEVEHIAQTIGRNSWGYGSETFANTGVFATSYMQFGIWGIFLYPVLLTLLFKLVDKLAVNRMPMDSAICLSIIPILQFIGSDLPTTVMSHGFAVLLFCMRFLNLESRAGHTG
jgi:hypothetical protein